MSTFEAWLTLIVLTMLAIVGYVEKQQKNNTAKWQKWQFNKLPKEEQERRIAAEEQRQRTVSELIRVWGNMDVELQYREHYSTTDPDTEWVKPEWRAYMKEEQKRRYGRSRCLQTYCLCFARERMIRDHKAVPKVIVDYQWTRVADPEDRLVFLSWMPWRSENYERVINHYNETGEFLMPDEWRPLKSIPDWNDGKNSALT